MAAHSSGVLRGMAAVSHDKRAQHDQAEVLVPRVGHPEQNNS